MIESKKERKHVTVELIGFPVRATTFNSTKNLFWLKTINDKQILINFKALDKNNLNKVLSRMIENEQISENEKKEIIKDWKENSQS